jgi:hypothetical protein
VNGIWIAVLADLFARGDTSCTYKHEFTQQQHLLIFPIVLFGWAAIMQNSDGTANRPFPYAGAVVITLVPEAPLWSLPLFGNNAKP